MAKTKNRKKVNFMIDHKILARIQELIPQGARSDFVNGAIDDALITYSRKKAFEGIRKLAKSAKLSMTTEEIIKLKNYGRP